MVAAEQTVQVRSEGVGSCASFRVCACERVLLSLHLLHRSLIQFRFFPTVHR